MTAKGTINDLRDAISESKISLTSAYEDLWVLETNGFHVLSVSYVWHLIEDLDHLLSLVDTLLHDLNNQPDMEKDLPF